MQAELQEFLDQKKSQAKSESTKNLYRAGLELFSSWLDDEGLTVSDVRRKHLEHFLAYMSNEKEYAPGTIRGYYSPIKQMYERLEDLGEINDNPAGKVSSADYAPRETRREQETNELRVWLTEQELTQLVQNVPAPSIRNRLLIMFQYFTGLRSQELVDIKLSDLDRDRRRVKVRGKGNKRNIAYWKPKLDGLLSQYIDGGYRDACANARESEYLFLPPQRTQLGSKRVNKVVVKSAEKAGIQEVLYTDAQGNDRHKITSHSLRHSYAVHFLQNGGTLEALKQFMAHSSITTTEIYGEILEERAREEYEKYGPDIDLDL